MASNPGRRSPNVFETDSDDTMYRRCPSRKRRPLTHRRNSEKRFDGLKMYLFSNMFSGSLKKTKVKTFQAVQTLLKNGVYNIINPKIGFL